jgi:GT2 family glycosyltransferase
VILPAYHSHPWLGACLQALRAQSFRDFEVVVVNSSDEEHTRALVQGFPEVVFEQSPHRLLPHAARNRAIELSRGALLAFTDPDCVPRPDWLERLVEAHDRRPGIVQGGMALREEATLLERAIHVCKWHALLPGQRPRPLSTVATGNSCCAREVWQSAGRFDGTLFGGDALLSWRAAARGAALWLAPDAVVLQTHDETFARLVRERWTRGQEFGRMRAGFEGWSRMRAAATIAATPLRLLVVLARCARDCARAGWLGWFLLTLPIHLTGQVAWVLGEALACARLVRGGLAPRASGGPG